MVGKNSVGCRREATGTSAKTKSYSCADLGSDRSLKHLHSKYVSLSFPLVIMGILVVLLIY